jgi:ubiquinone/menaquinone biosynthesis C-methylase UbiE
MAPMDVDQIKQRQALIWGLGDYAVLSDELRPAAVALCNACAVSAGQEVLDVGAGDGNFALACAREGASVVASDISPGMIERGRARARAEGYEVDWVEADAEALPFEDERFDCVGSVFGAMIAPRPEVVARELFRVVRPGGTVGMTAWTPGAFVPLLGQISSKYVPRDPDQPLPEEWGDEQTARRRFEGLAAQVDFETGRLVSEAESAEAFLRELRASAPPLVAAKQALPPDRYEAMTADVLELVRRLGGDGPFVLESEYALIVARKRG